MPTFTNPYLSTPDRRLATYISEDVWKYFKGIRLQSGTLTIITNTLIDKFHQACVSHGISDLTQSNELESFLVNCVIVDPTRPFNGSSTGGVDQPTNASDVPGTVKGKNRRSKAAKVK
jgi:hypothetical protein